MSKLKTNSVDLLLKLTEGQSFRFSVTGINFPKSFDVKNVLVPHKNNKNEVHIKREKDSLYKYGNFSESDTNGILKNILKLTNQKPAYSHKNTYKLRKEMYEGILNLVVDTELFTISNHSISNIDISLNNDGSLHSITIKLLYISSDEKVREYNTLKLFDFEPIKEYKFREKDEIE